MSTQSNEERLARVEDAVIQHAEHSREMRQSLGKMSDALVTLATLEVRHSATRAGLEKLEKCTEEHGRRLGAIEVMLPLLVEARGYVLKAMLSVVGLVAVSVAGLVLVK